MQTGCSLSSFLLLTAAAAGQTPPPLLPGRPAAGSWFGKAVQLCADPANCPKLALFMTPTLTAEGMFVGNDTLTLVGLPFGPHTTAHGKWIPSNRTSIIADYVFILTAPPAPAESAISALRFRWQAEVVEPNTMVGYANI